MTKLSAFTALVAGASAASLPVFNPFTGAPKLDPKVFETKPIHTISLTDIVELVRNQTDAPKPEAQFGTFAAAATCSNPRVRVEWDDSTDTQKQNYVNALKCMLGRPSKGNYPGSKNRYEDFVQVHQAVTDNVHNNRKFMVWHRAFLWAFDETLRSECGFTDSLLWFDETKYPGRFSQSSVFSSRWLGAINLGGNCVTDGQFANLALNIGPGTGNSYHCLARNGNAADTSNVNSNIVNGCQALNSYQDFARCSEQGAHAYGHNGIGSVMRDVYASPGDPVFWLHHAMVDRHFRVWQNLDGSRVNYINGEGPGGQPLTMDTPIYLNGLKPDLKVQDIMNTLGGFLCYRYNY